MGSRSLGDRVAYVSADELCLDMTVRQVLDEACAFVHPATSAFRAGSMVTVFVRFPS